MKKIIIALAFIGFSFALVGCEEMMHQDTGVTTTNMSGSATTGQGTTTSQ